MHLTLLDIDRAREKVAVHYRGDADRLISATRGGLLMDTAEQIQRIIDIIAAGSETNDSIFDGHEILHVSNRFADPALSGYRDLKLYLRDAGGMVYTVRVFSRPFERQAFFKTSEMEWQLAKIVADRVIGGTSPAQSYVLIKDNYLREEPDGLHVVWGFPSTEEAQAYGRSRLSSSLRPLKSFSVSLQDLIDNWMMFGEDFAVVGADGKLYVDQVIEARLILCDIEEAPQWAGDGGIHYVKAPIRLD